MSIVDVPGSSWVERRYSSDKGRDFGESAFEGV
jgi:hypothetical protein